MLRSAKADPLEEEAVWEILAQVFFLSLEGVRIENTIDGRQLVERLRRLKVPAGRYEAYFYPGHGHDTDRMAAPIATHNFLSGVSEVKRK